MSKAFFGDLARQGHDKRANKKQFAEIRRSLLADLLEKQRAVIEDTYRYKSVLCPRRAGKTYTAIRYALYTALKRDNALVVVTTLTLKSAKRLYWKELRDLMDAYGIKHKAHHTSLEITINANGSKIFLAGAETSSDVERLRGMQFDLVIVDECKSFHPRIFEEFLDDVMSPALLDRGGTMLLVGTPGTDLAGPFYEATCPDFKSDTGVHKSRPYSERDLPYWKVRKARWSFHTWTQVDNTAMPQIWEGALELKEMNNWADDHPTWMREYLGLWVPGENSRVFVFADANTKTDPQGDPLCTFWPDEESSNVFGLSEGETWNYVLGVDLGFEDSTAFVVGAWSPTDPVFRFVWSYKAQHMLPDDIAKNIKRLEAMTGGFAGMVADTGGLGKMIVETLNFEHGFNIEAAKKTEKLDHIELMNGDYWSGRIKHLHGLSLSEEMTNLHYDLSRGSKSDLLRIKKLRVERDAEDHLSDAALYTYRYAMHKLSRARIVAPKRGSAAWQEAQEQEAAERAIRKRAGDTDKYVGKKWSDYE